MVARLAEHGTAPCSLRAGRARDGWWLGTNDDGAGVPRGQHPSPAATRRHEPNFVRRLFPPSSLAHDPVPLRGSCDDRTRRTTQDRTAGD